MIDIVITGIDTTNQTIIDSFTNAVIQAYPNYIITSIGGSDSFLEYQLELGGS